MAKKVTDASPLSAFEGIVGNISGNVSQSGSINLDDPNLDADDDSVADLSVKPGDKQSDDDTDLLVKDDNDDDDIKDDSSDNDDDTEGEEPTKQAKQSKKQKDTDDTDNDVDVDPEKDAESGQVGLFFDAFNEALGWEVGEDEEKPNTIEDLIDYMRDLVEESSEPSYADNKVKELNDYIANGGKYEDYFKMQTQISELDTLDLDEEEDQKKVIREYYKSTGYTDTQIDKKISRWEDAGVLEDEAKESFDLLKEVKEKEKTQAIKEQEQARIQQEKTQQEFYTNIVNKIEDLKEIKGIKIPAEDRKKLKDYALKVESDGKTKYQKDLGKDIVTSFIEQAYFTMKGDSFVKSAKRSGETSAVSKLRASMKTNKFGRSSESMDNSSPTPIWAAASSVFGVK